MGKARGKANGEVWKAKARGGTDGAARPNPRRRAGNARARGPLGAVPHDAPSELKRHFGEVVRVERDGQGYSQTQFAKLARIGRSVLGYMEKGIYRTRLDTAERVADALGFHVEALIARARRRMVRAAERGVR